MWEARTTTIPSGLRYRIAGNGSLLSFRQLFTLLEHDRGFAAWYTGRLTEAPFPAFFWEHPPITAASFEAPAEFVLIESDSLARLEPDPRPFEAQLSAETNASVATFPNLGGDAWLVVPRPLASPDAYSHLAAFARNAPRAQVLALWATAARAVREQLSGAPHWLSTAGLGVAWLHLRLDTRPKYYRHTPYTTPPEHPGPAEG